MRVFKGDDGKDWEVVVGRESWGVCYAIFLPRQEAQGPLQAMLKATSMQEALGELMGMDQGELNALLAGATEKPLD